MPIRAGRLSAETRALNCLTGRHRRKKALVHQAPSTHDPLAVIRKTSGTTVSNGLEVIFGTVSGVVLNGSAYEFVSGGGVASGTTINGGGAEYVLPGGTANGAKLSGGMEIICGTANSTTITSGIQDVMEGGTANATVLSGGFEYVLSGGTASGTIIKGGYEYVFSGGVATGTVISSGTLEIASGGSIGTGAVTFFGGGSLRLDDAVHFGGLVAGFGMLDQLDLPDIAFMSGTTSATWQQFVSGSTGSGTLTVTDGTNAAHITLLGQYMAENFHIATDGHGGTLVTDPPVSSSDPNQLALANAHS
jgi:autotransporter passenger strand-loop-strand repeat protein